MNLKGENGIYIGTEIDEKELKFIRNLIFSTKDICRLCPEDPSSCGKFGYDYRMCNQLVWEIDNVLGFQ